MLNFDISADASQLAQPSQLTRPSQLTHPSQLTRPSQLTHLSQLTRLIFKVQDSKICLSRRKQNHQIFSVMTSVYLTIN